MYIAAGDVRKRLSQQLTAPRKTRFNKDPDDPSGTTVYNYMLVFRGNSVCLEGFPRLLRDIVKRFCHANDIASDPHDP